MIESRGVVCRCERGSAVNRGERETATHLPRLPSRFTRTPAGVQCRVIEAEVTVT